MDSNGSTGRQDLERKMNYERSITFWRIIAEQMYYQPMYRIMNQHHPLTIDHVSCRLGTVDPVTNICLDLNVGVLDDFELVDIQSQVRPTLQMLGDPYSRAESEQAYFLWYVSATRFKVNLG